MKPVAGMRLLLKQSHYPALRRRRRRFRRYFSTNTKKRPPRLFSKINFVTTRYTKTFVAVFASLRYGSMMGTAFLLDCFASGGAASTLAAAFAAHRSTYLLRQP